MDPETNHQTNHQFRRLPKGERRVRFADSMGMELVSIFLFDLISNYYFASIHNHKQLPPPPKTMPTNNNNSQQTAPNITQRSNYSTHTLKTATSTLLTSTPSKPIITNLHTYQNQRRSSTQTPSPTLKSNHVNNNNNNNITSTHHHSTSSHSLISNNSDTNNSSTLIKNNINHHNNNNNQTLSHYNDSYICEFTQPISLVSFKERVKLNKVHLETCSVSSRAGNISVSCTIRVLNLSYDKSVIVRYTTDEWHTFTDSLASYKPGSNDGWSDKFTSTFSVTNQVKSFQTGQRIIFAIRYVYDGDKVHWDNNGGLNYTVKKV